MSKIQAIIQVLDQVGPDDFQMYYHSKSFDKAATIQEIETWALRYGKFSIFDIKFATNDEAERGE